MKKIDSHLHVNFCGFDIEGLINYMDSNGVDKCWLLTWEEKQPTFPSLYENLSIDQVLDAHNIYPDRIIPFYAPDPGRNNWKDIMKYYKSKGIAGCGELKVTYKWHDNEIKKTLDGIYDLDLPIIFHMEDKNYHFFPIQDNIFSSFLEKVLNGAFNGIIRKHIEQSIEKTGILKNTFHKNLYYFPGYMMDFAGLEKRLRQYPNVNFIAHGPAFWNHIDKHPDPYLTFTKGKIIGKGLSVKLLEEYDNLHADISGKSGFNALKRDPGFTRNFLNNFYEKLLYGTDNEYKLPYETIIAKANLPEYKLKRFMVKNAEMLCY